MVAAEVALCAVTAAVRGGEIGKHTSFLARFCVCLVERSPNTKRGKNIERFAISPFWWRAQHERVASSSNLLCPRQQISYPQLAGLVAHAYATAMGDARCFYFISCTCERGHSGSGKNNKGRPSTTLILVSSMEEPHLFSNSLFILTYRNWL